MYVAFKLLTHGETFSVTNDLVALLVVLDSAVAQWWHTSSTAKELSWPEVVVEVEDCETNGTGTWTASGLRESTGPLATDESLGDSCLDLGLQCIDT